MLADFGDMGVSDTLPSSPLGPGTSSDDALAYYKAQYELLEAELADFQASSKDLEAELEKDIEAAENRERGLKERATNLAYEIDEWKAKHKQAKNEASNAQVALQKEITTLRETNRALQLRLRDIEVANDDFERQQRNTESSLEDLESKYNQSVEREVMLEEDIRAGEQERETLRIEAQRLRDEFSDLKIEADINKEKLRLAETDVDTRQPISLAKVTSDMASARSEVSPTTTDSQAPFDTPPRSKTASSSAVSDIPTPPSPPMSEKSSNSMRAFATPSLPRSRKSLIAVGTTPRATTTTQPRHVRGPSLLTNPAGRGTPSTASRQSMSRPGSVAGQVGLPKSNSIYQLRNLRGKMQKLEERVHTAKSRLPDSRLPAPTSTPPKVSPCGDMNTVPSSITMRSGRGRRPGGSTISGPESLPDQDNTPSVSRTKVGRTSFGFRPGTPSRTEMPPPRPESRASAASQSSASQYAPGHRRPGSRASISNFKTVSQPSQTLGSFNASTSMIRPKSSLSSHGLNVTVDTEDDNHTSTSHGTSAPRRIATARVSNFGTAIPSPGKRTSIGNVTKFSRRTSTGHGDSEMRPPPSRDGSHKAELGHVSEDYLDETF